jgi:hypothetical protein
VISTRRIFRSGTTRGRKAIHDLSGPHESELLARQTLEVAIITPKRAHLSPQALILQQEPGDSLLDRRLFAHERAKTQEAATAEEDGRDERQRYAGGRNDREALSQHSTAQRRLTHRRGRYMRRRPEYKHHTITRSPTPETAYEEGVEW